MGLGVSCQFSISWIKQESCPLHLKGIEVDYKGDIDHFPSGKMTIRLLLILWTGDHPAQCEVCKSKGAGGKKGCRRCKKVGVFHFVT